MDAFAAFLHGVPDEVIYLRIPDYVNIPNATSKTVLCVNKLLYSLKQSPRCWYYSLCSFFTSIDFKASVSDNCLFTSNKKSDPCYIHIHVDDLTIAGTKSSIASFKALISAKFEVEDLGEVSTVLGMCVTRNRALQQLTLHQYHYVDNLLLTFGMLDCKPVSTPMEPNTYLLPPSDE